MNRYLDEYSYRVGENTAHDTENLDELASWETEDALIYFTEVD